MSEWVKKEELCAREDCGAYSTGWPCNCSYLNHGLPAVKGCDKFTTTPTTGIPTDRLTQLEAIEADHIKNMARLAEAEELIGELQWAGTDNFGDSHCPICYHNPEGKHTSKCEIKQFLSQSNPVNKPETRREG